MTTCFFVSDLHGHLDRYQMLFQTMRAEQPEALFLGGDFLPLGLPAFTRIFHQDFINEYLVKQLIELRRILRDAFPKIFIIMGNDDPRFEEAGVWEAATQGVWEYIHNRKIGFKDFNVYGYGYVPPTPFRLKDWERYDVSRYADPDCVSPEEGVRSFPVSDQEKRYATIQSDLARIGGEENLDRAIFLFHAPPYDTKLDLVARESKMVDHVPLDQHVGSIAIRRFIENRQPLLTLHGHIHESARLSSSWRDLIGRTHCFSAAHDGPELTLIRFDPESLEAATRQLI
ncbi:MAG: metallophosphoesterase [Candidatus Aminicenantes bacterium]|nr:metallophosphoesterase [Candidatus Aminicenantes bacterium]